MEQGYLAIALHAHLPFVRHPEYQDSLEERWLYEAITETYIPLLLTLEKLADEGLDFRLTFTVTPTLTSMLLDPFLQSRYLGRLELLIELAEKEVSRTRSQPEFQALARMYHDHFLHLRQTYTNRYKRDLVQAFRRLQERGRIEILASAATHGYLPLLSVSAPAVRTQIRLGIESYEQVFGCKPRGFWLPECGYFTGLDELLREYGIRFTILETHGITRAVPRPKYGVYAPVASPSGIVFFGRDPNSSRQVWSATEGYPGDFDYRDFYRDIAHDLDLDYIKPYVHRDGIRIDTGIKYHRVTGKTEVKEAYDPERADAKAGLHARHFLSSRRGQVEHLAARMDRKPIVAAPYDAELFGHWWYEGPRWLEYLIRAVNDGEQAVRLITFSEYLEEYTGHQIAEPCPSSWGHKGYNEVWLNDRNDWIYPHLHRAALSLEKAGAGHARAGGPARRALNQAARELLLAQASDWAFIMNSGTMVDYAKRRTKAHLLRLHKLARQIEEMQIDQDWLSALESQDNIFARLDTAKDFAERPAVEEAVVEKAGASPAEDAAGLARPLHVVMVSPEIIPFAKTGGLADMVGSLAVALERLGARVSLILPGYRSALKDSFILEETGIRVAVPVSSRKEDVTVLRTKAGREIPVYLIRSDRYFDRDGLYGTASGDYPDNAERFVLFARAALEALHGMDPPDILHCHDWQSALAVAFLRAQPQRYPALSGTRTVLTVHNLGYQGLFRAEDWHLLNLDRRFFTPRHVESYGKINFLKAGVVFSDAITTVSGTYAEEIKTREHGFGLEGVFQERAERLVGILNGADYDVWDPATDRFIAHNYNLQEISGKQVCKADLQRHLGLSEAADVPILAVVSRLANQKGLDILRDVLDALLGRNLQFVLLGTGERRYEDHFRALPQRHPGKVAVRIAFDEALAHKIEAGADLFVMPSRYEPSGLNQFYSLKYGTIPIVRATGGLKDSIEEFDPATGSGTGFLFVPYEGRALLAAVDRALSFYPVKEKWTALMRNAMSADFSWDRSARSYLDLYRKLSR